jgi:hypothetical protein
MLISCHRKYLFVVGNAISTLVQIQAVTDRILFGNNALINEFTNSLTEIEILDGGWTTKYLDTKTGHYWLKYLADDRNFIEHLIRASPTPTTDQLIDKAFSSTYPDEVIAAATRLYIEEQLEQKEFRKALLERLNSMDTTRLDKAEKERLKSIIQASQLTNRVNNRDIVGKQFSEIKSDSDFFMLTAENAEKILNNL